MGVSDLCHTIPNGLFRNRFFFVFFDPLCHKRYRPIFFTRIYLFGKIRKNRTIPLLPSFRSSGWFCFESFFPDLIVGDDPSPHRARACYKHVGDFLLCSSLLEKEYGTQMRFALFVDCSSDFLFKQCNGNFSLKRYRFVSLFLSHTERGDTDYDFNIALFSGWDEVF